MSLAIGWCVGAFVITVLLVRLAIGYAHRRGMLDQPGKRRSHQVATPRGGGVGIVLAVLVCMPGALLTMPQPWSAAVVGSLMFALAIVALAGWWDDHRPLPALPRLLMQLVAVLVFALALVVSGLSWWWLPLLLLVGVWSINLHNFMDGIDGLLAQQAIFVACGCAGLAFLAGQSALMVMSIAVAAASFGFWLSNRPPARIFMGDVGSGSLGLLIFALAAMLWFVDRTMLWPGLILSSAFVIDASLTLMTRILQGRRWYAAHREHLYQWQARRRRSHATVDLQYMGWNLLVAAPASWLAWSHPSKAVAGTMGIYFLGAAIWLVLKRRSLRRQPYRNRHVTA